MTLALVPVYIASLCIESVFYGIFCALFALSLLLISSATPRGARRIYPISAPVFCVLIFIVVTAHWVASAVRAFQAFFLHRGGQDPVAFLSDISQFSAIFKQGALLGVLFSGDLASVYRLWAIWGHHRGVIILPVVLLAVLSALAVISLYEFIAPGPDLLRDPMKLEASMLFWVLAISATTFSINAYNTGMIALKLYKAGRASGDGQFAFIATIFVESLSLHTVWGVGFLISYGLASPLYILTSDAQSAVTGIAFMILHVRAGIRRLGCNTSV
ncbi:hypothetical protein BD779DRAFT_1674187 [Infundibulicybe gibba]|nr:hypothetical protein BD779DRAFT_1674187 [Infundibulicybe gibba]